ncbi:uncharacterized protein LOC109853039 [Pseudomyrmex gracilis]|uniref:uncharacterized protein LOC109853039 n=1 Tax=Pseudomyrmex gracilis TaxID=219809 RepID=UPI0009950248|nr:uncharacterized protein LOC109853039 [Pseudomyrmex gracilis]
MFLMIVCVADLSLNMCLVCQIVLCGNDIKELLIHLIFIASVLIYMFLANYISQDITDNNNDVFVTVYNVQWYRSPIEIQKMILFLLQRKTKSFTLHLGKIVTGSFENMAKLMNASLSYFAVLYSTQ